MTSPLKIKIKSKFKTLVILSSIMALTSIATAQETYVPSKENVEAREWFQDAKFGIFIHWGVYSQLAGGGNPGGEEWIMETEQIPIDKYERLGTTFNPVKFDADEWVLGFKSSGAKYITITSKHHDGFAMYDSAVSDYDIAEENSFGRDIMKELKAACDKHGIKLFFYYSQLDWHHPDYYPRGGSGQGYTGRPMSGDWDKYIDYQNAQLKELLTNYGDIGGFWFDGWWDHRNDDYKERWRLEETYKLIHDLQPHALVINNHHVTPYPGEDVQPFEQDLPGENHSGFNTMEVTDEMPIEMAQTMNGSWGFSLTDDAFKSTKELIQTLVGAAGRNSNYLMNTGPMSDGRIQPENVQTYKEMGEWFKVYGESIYGTRGGPIGPRPWGVTTRKDNALYVHVLDWKDSILTVPLEGVEVASATLVRNGKSISYEITNGGLALNIPMEELNEFDAVIKIMIK